MKASRYLAILLLPFLLCRCGEPDPDQGGAGVSSVNVTFDAFPRADGSVSGFVISETDKVVLVHPASGERSEAGPLAAGSNSSLYNFNLRNPVKDDLLAGWYPASAGVDAGTSAITFDFPSEQSGGEFSPVYIGKTRCTGSAYAGDAISLKPFASLILARMQKGDYSVTGARITAPGGEMLSGRCSVDPATMKVSGSAASVTVKLPEPMDCSGGSCIIPVFVPPVELSKGFEITFSLADGSSFSCSNTSRLSLKCGEVVETAAGPTRTLLACGSSRIYIFDEAQATAAGHYSGALKWSWDARKYASRVGLAESRMDHIDDAKIVDGGSRILVTSSYGWAAMVNRASGEVEWSANSVSNAHSAELLPSGRVAVARSSGPDGIRIYNLSTSNVEIASYVLASAHGVVWNGKAQRLFAIGGTSLQIWKLKDWDGASPSLELEKTVDTGSFVSALHDMSPVDENTLALAGNRAALYNISTGEFTSLPHFSTYTGVKSINCNAATGEAYYTYAWTGVSEGDYTWSSHKVRYTSDIFANDAGADTSVIEVDDINMYKVRVVNW